MTKHLRLIALLLVFGCVPPPQDQAVKTQQPEKEETSLGDGEREPKEINLKNIPPRPARTTCPPGMVGSC